MTDQVYFLFGHRPINFYYPERHRIRSPGGFNHYIQQTECVGLYLKSKCIMNHPRVTHFDVNMLT